MTAYTNVLMPLMFHFADQADCRLSDGRPDFEKAMDKARVLYKQWRFSLRVDAVQRLVDLAEGEGEGNINLPNCYHQPLLEQIIDYATRSYEGDEDDVVVDKFTQQQKQQLLGPVMQCMLAKDECNDGGKREAIIERFEGLMGKANAAQVVEEYDAKAEEGCSQTAATLS